MDMNRTHCYIWILPGTRMWTFPGISCSFDVYKVNTNENS